MKKIRFLLILCILLTTKIFYAQQQVSSLEARNAAMCTFYEKLSVLNKNVSDDARIKSIHNFRNENGDTLMYEVIFQNKMGVLLSGSKACLPVLAYYTQPEHENSSIFDANNENIPCCLKELIREYAIEIDSCFVKKTKELHYATQWQELQNTSPSRISKTATVVVEPLLKTVWAQTYATGGCCDAFNYYVTEEHKKCKCSSTHCPVGCTATAMAQIMKRWNHPVYQPSKIVQFDWCNMPDTLYCNDNPRYETERNAIARLMKDCGDAANTNYCSGGCSSSSTIYKARQAFVNDLGYSSDADHQWKSSYSINTWKERIKNNLNNGWPVLYGGYDPSPPAGHSFVLDGYTNDDYFHVNWGWGTGWNDVYCTLDNLTLDGSTFSTQSACFYIYPNDTQNYCNFTFPLWFHYNYWVNTLGFPVSFIHLTIPKTFTTLESVPAENGFPASWHTIESGEVAEYVAHEEIRLLPGFHAKAGSYFVARIEPCTNCNSAKVIMKRLLDNGVEVKEELYIAVGDNEEESLSESKIAADAPQIYPNPTTGLLTIYAKNDNSRIQMIELYNTQGVKLFNFSGNHDFFQEIDISHLPSQVYILKIQVNRQIFSKKLILQK